VAGQLLTRLKLHYW